MRLWRDRISGGINASLVATQELVYILATDGRMTIVNPSSGFEVIAENRLGEQCCTSPAISQGQLYIRGQSHLFCIGNRAEPPSTSPQ
jgi:outer membrane protein assembly factor BamB